jgi:hypothetical protein
VVEVQGELAPQAQHQQPVEAAEVLLHLNLGQFFLLGLCLIYYMFRLEMEEQEVRVLVLLEYKVMFLYIHQQLLIIY